MGFEPKREKRTWIKINTKEGKFQQKVNGQVIFEDRPFTGKLENIEIENGIYDNKPTRELQLFFNDAGEKYVVAVNADTEVSNNILNTLLNINVIGEITIGVFLSESKKKPGKMGCAVWIRNNGEKTNGWKYKKDADGNLPKGFPEPIVVEFKGKKNWDFTPVSQFLWDQTVAVTIPKLKGAGYVATSAPAAVDAEQQAPEDDLPW
jgi:hypothetical protein